MIAYAKLRDEEYFAESIEEYNQKIDEAVAEMNEGKFLEHEEAIKMFS
jgi:predicted transcriptional regulator